MYFLISITFPIILFLSLQLQAQSVSFINTLTYPTITTATGFGAADLNNDNKIDLIISNYYYNTISIYKGNGDGSFTKDNYNYATCGSGWPGNIFTADLNNDGFLDLILGRAYYGINVMLNNGNGAFPTCDYYNISPYYYSDSYSLVIGNFDSDSFLDLVVANFRTNELMFLKGNGNGTFQTPVLRPTLSNPNLYIAEDFNGDNKLDLVVVYQQVSYPAESKVRILLGNGDGTFTDGQEFNLGVGAWAVLAKLADFNNDSNWDFVVLKGGTNNIAVMLGRGDGTFEYHTDIPTAIGPNGITVGDFNLDNNQDIATANAAAGSLSIILGNGNGTFQSKIDFAAGTNPVSLITAKFDPDLKPDIALIHYTETQEAHLINLMIFKNTTIVNTAPVANAGTDQTIDCAPLSGSTVTLNGSGSNDADGDTLTYSWSNGATTAAQTLALAPGTHTFTLTVNDGKGGSSSDNVVITINADVTAPVVTAPAALVVNATVLGGFVGAIGAATATDACDPNPTITNNAPTQFPLGETVVTWTATDANGNVSSASQSVTVKQSTMLAKSLTIPVLQGLLPVSKNVDKKIGEAVKDIQQSVKAELWIDEYHLSTKKGEKVFEEEKEAVNQLLTLLRSEGDHESDDDNHESDDDHENKNNSIDSATQAMLLTVVLTLVDADKAIATLAFTEAQANCTSSKCLKKLDEASKKMSDAQKMFNDKKYAQAIDKYKGAWKSIIEINGKSFHKDGSQDLTQQSGEIPSEYGLSQNYPNPFNPTTVIDFAITESGYYTLKIYNTLGQEVAELVNDQLEGGNYSLGFDASKLVSGLYIYNIKGTKVNISKKMILMK